MDTRRCTKCGEEKPFDGDHFRSDTKGQAGTDGRLLGSTCKACFNTWQREYKARKQAGEPARRRGRPPKGAPSAPSAPGAPEGRRGSSAPGAPETVYAAVPPRTRPALSVGAPSAPSAPRGAKYSGSGWTKRGFIIRTEHLDRLKDEAWQTRRDVTAVLDGILAAHFGKA